MVQERFIIATELLMAQGFSSTRWSATAMGVPYLDLSRLSQAARAKLAGNAMHSACMCAVLAWI